MNKQHLFFILCSIIVCMTSCQNNLDEYCTPRHQHESNNPLNYWDSISTYEELSSHVHDYITNNQELFGSDVMVFDSWEELDTELSALQQMTYAQHRQWLNEHQLNSPVLNSIIIHDSVQTAVWQSFGIVFDTTSLDMSNLDFIEEYIEDASIQELEDRAFEEYDEIMSNDFAEYVNNECDSNGIITLSPLGVLNEQIFCNNLNLFICEGIVVKYLSDGVLSCPIYEYCDYADANSISEIHVPDSPNRIIVSPSAPNDKTIASANGQKYKTSVHFNVTVSGGWFGSEWKRTSMCATNYHRNSSGEYRCVACETKIIADVGITCHTGSWDYHFRTGWCPMKGGMIYYRVESVRCGCPFTRFSYIDLNLRNQHGVVINESYNFNN